MSFLIENKKQLTIGQQTAIVCYDPEKDYFRAAEVWPLPPIAQQANYCPEWIEHTAFQGYAASCAGEKSDLIVFSEEESGFEAVTFWPNRIKLFDAAYREWMQWRYSSAAPASEDGPPAPSPLDPDLLHYWKRAKQATLPKYLGRLTAREVFDGLGRQQSYQQDPPVPVEQADGVVLYLTKIYIHGKGIAYSYTTQRQVSKNAYLYRAYGTIVGQIDDELFSHVMVTYPEKYQRFIYDNSNLLQTSCATADFYPKAKIVYRGATTDANSAN